MREILSSHERHESQRGYFAWALYNEMARNKDIWLITADLGYKVFDRHIEAFPERAINVGAAENAAIDIGVGLALEGKIPVVYSITPFLLYRPFEAIRNYINHEQIPVKLVGSGRDTDYAHDGFSHHAQDDKAVMSLLTNIHSHWPQTKEEILTLTPHILSDPRPQYLNLTR